jgi:hypothetical protein
MSAVILPNGSLLFRLVGRTIHVDAPAGAIHVRDGRTRSEFGEILASVPMSTTAMVRLLSDSPGEPNLYLEFETGDVLDLGKVPQGEAGRHIAYALARLARCRVSTTIEHTRPTLRGPQIIEIPANDRATTFERPRVIDLDKTDVDQPLDPSAPIPTISAEIVDDEAPTKPPEDPADHEVTIRIDLPQDRAALPRIVSA